MPPRPPFRKVHKSRAAIVKTLRRRPLKGAPSRPNLDSGGFPRPRSHANPDGSITAWWDTRTKQLSAEEANRKSVTVRFRTLYAIGYPAKPEIDAAREDREVTAGIPDKPCVRKRR